ncbi:MAG: SpoIIE family protein phosphatase [Phycisphaerae bacterium]|nr:SpoIIE family protein phosphatase [Phycisphaerae bacterium]
MTRRLATTTDLDQLLPMIIETACDSLDCERATIFLYDTERDELYSRAAKDAVGIRFPADRGIAGTAAMERVVVNVPDAYADPRFNKEVDKKTGFKTRNLLTFPLENMDGHLIGVLQALNKRSGPFDEDDEELANILSAQAGVALDRGRLLEEYAEKQRMERDLDIARQIQLGLFPEVVPVIAGYDVAGWNQPADQCGGDTYDIIQLEDGRLLIALADATGHGIGPALVIAQFHALVRGMLQVTTDVAEICAAVNRVLCEDLDDERFVTAFVGVLDPKTHVVEYVSCGQGPIMHLKQASFESRGATSVPFAVIPDIEYTAERIHLLPGDLLVLLTDGFYEAPSRRDELFGEERVVELIRRGEGAPLDGLISNLHREIQKFCEGRAQADDLTAVILRRGQ